MKKTEIRKIGKNERKNTKYENMKIRKIGYEI